MVESVWVNATEKKNYGIFRKFCKIKIFSIPRNHFENFQRSILKFIHSEKATKFCEIFTLLLTGTTKDKSKMKNSQNFVAFSDYMNFTETDD